MDRRVREVGVAGDGVLDEVGDGREHQRPLNTELIEQLDSRTGLAEGGDAVDRLTGHLSERESLGVVARVIGHVRARTRDAVEGRVRDELGECALHRQSCAPAHLDELDVACVALRQVVEPRRALVEVVVGVEDGKAGIVHRCSKSGEFADDK